MEEKLEGKKEWITPEIIDLDVEKTTSADLPSVHETGSYGPTES